MFDWLEKLLKRTPRMDGTLDNPNTSVDPNSPNNGQRGQGGTHDNPNTTIDPDLGSPFPSLTISKMQSPDSHTAKSENPNSTNPKPILVIREMKSSGSHTIMSKKADDPETKVIATAFKYQMVAGRPSSSEFNRTEYMTAEPIIRQFGEMPSSQSDRTEDAYKL